MKTLGLLLMTFIFVACNGAGGNQAEYFKTTNYYAYVTNFNDDTIDVKKVNKTSGELDLVEVQTTCDRPNKMDIHPNEKFLYVTCSGDNSVMVYAINQSTGELSQVEEETSVGTYPHGISTDGSGKYLYVSNESDAEIAAFSIASNGEITPIGTIASGNAPHDVQVIGDYVYVANYSGLSNSVSVYDIQGDGTLSLVEEETAGTNPKSIYAVGNYLITANRGSNNITVFSRNPLTGELSSPTNYGVGTAPTSIAYSSGYLYVSNWSDDTTSVFSMDTSTGALTSEGTSNVGDGPVHLIPISALSMVLTVNENGGDLHGYERLNNGFLSNTATSSFVGNAPMHGVYVSITN